MNFLKNFNYILILIIFNIIYILINFYQNKLLFVIIIIIIRIINMYINFIYYKLKKLPNKYSPDYIIQ